MRNKLLLIVLLLICCISSKAQDSSILWLNNKDLIHIYSIYPNTPPQQDVILSVEQASFTSDTLRFRLNLYNNGQDTICLLKPTLSDIESSIFIIFLIENKTGDKIRLYIQDVNGHIISSQISCIGIFYPLIHLICLYPKNGFYQDYAIPYKLNNKEKYSIQLILDYEFTIKSPIPLKNLVQQELESNKIEIIVQ